MTIKQPLVSSDRFLPNADFGTGFV